MPCTQLIRNCLKRSTTRGWNPSLRIPNSQTILRQFQTTSLVKKHGEHSQMFNNENKTSINKYQSQKDHHEQPPFHKRYHGQLKKRNQVRFKETNTPTMGGDKKQDNDKKPRHQKNIKRKEKNFPENYAPKIQKFINSSKFIELIPNAVANGFTPAQLDMQKLTSNPTSLVLQGEELYDVHLRRHFCMDRFRKLPSIDGEAQLDDNYRKINFITAAYKLKIYVGHRLATVGLGSLDFFTFLAHLHYEHGSDIAKEFALNVAGVNEQTPTDIIKLYMERGDDPFELLKAYLWALSRFAVQPEYTKVPIKPDRYPFYKSKNEKTAGVICTIFYYEDIIGFSKGSTSEGALKSASISALNYVLSRCPSST